MYDDVLVATDGSDGGLAAVERAVSLAAATDATVHLLYVVDVGVAMAASGVGTVAEELTKSLEAMASNALDDAEAVAEAADVPYDRTAVEGFPAEAIRDRCESVDADVVVVGASGQSGLGARLLGTTSDRVVREVPVDVLVVRPRDATRE